MKVKKKPGKPPENETNRILQQCKARVTKVLKIVPHHALPPAPASHFEFKIGSALALGFNASNSFKVLKISRFQMSFLKV